MRRVKFRKWTCDAKFARYGNGRVAIKLIDVNDESLVAVASVNLDDGVEMAADEIAIKDYSENEGMLAAMIAADIVSEPLRYESTGYVTVPICKLLVEPE